MSVPGASWSSKEGPIVPAEQTRVRAVSVDDAEALALHLARDRVAFARWEPARTDQFYTRTGQEERLDRLLLEVAAGRSWAAVILTGEEVVGQVTVSGIVGEPFLRGSLGYWVASAHQGHGHATRAVAQVLRVMTADLGLHRAEASTQPANLGSQRVLRANGFTLSGVAHELIRIEGAWRDSLLWERTLTPDLASGDSTDS